MGADGGIVYIPVREQAVENYNRVLTLLEPFWQFLSDNGVSSVAEENNYRWREANLNIGAPNYIVGCYGTDLCDKLTLDCLEIICEEDDSGLYDLTFDELDLECRTSPFSINGEHYNHILHNLWFQHFKYSTREETLKALDNLAGMKISNWCREIKHLLYLNQKVCEETWT